MTESTFTPTEAVPEEVAELLKAACTIDADRETMRIQSLELKRDAVTRLKHLGWSNRRIAPVLDLTHQRVDQIFKGTR